MSQKEMRLIVNLGKFQVVQVNKGAIGVSFTIQLPNNVKMNADLIYPADVRLGDYLTLYTEVLVDADHSGTH